MGEIISFNAGGSILDWEAANSSCSLVTRNTSGQPCTVNTITSSPLSHFSTVKPQAFFRAENQNHASDQSFYVIELIFFFFFFFSKSEFLPRTMKISKQMT